MATLMASMVPRIVTGRGVGGTRTRDSVVVGVGAYDKELRELRDGVQRRSHFGSPNTSRT